MTDDDFFDSLKNAFRDVDHVDRLRRRLYACKQERSVQQYIHVFRGIVLELGPNAPDDDDLLFYCI